MRQLVTLSCALAITLGGAAALAAEPHRRVVVLRFDGPRQVADDARALVMDVAGADNDVVALGRWADAHRVATRKLRGARAWAASAREAEVDAIIEGSVRRGRRGYALELVVREATTGNQLDAVELQVDDERRAARTIEGELTDMLAWIEPPTERRQLERLDRRNDRDDDRWRDDDRRRGDRDDDRRREDDRDRDDDRRRDDRDDRWRDDDRDDRRRDDDRVRDELGFRDDLDDRDLDDRDLDDPDRDLDDPDRDLAAETVALLDGEHGRGSRRAAAGRAPMLRVAGGGYLTSRSLTFTASGAGAPGGDGGHPTVGVHLRADLFPFAESGAGRRLTGLGLQLELARAIGNKVAADVDGQPAQLGVAQGLWSVALAYRRPLDPVIVQLDLGCGATKQLIEGRPASVTVVDAAYAYVRAGGKLEVPVSPRATLAGAAHYLYLTGAPAMQAMGAASATGLDAEASVEVPLTRSLTALGGIDYQRINLTFAGAAAGASAATDAFLSARVALGVVY